MFFICSTVTFSLNQLQYGPMAMPNELSEEGAILLKLKGSFHQKIIQTYNVTPTLIAE